MNTKETHPGSRYTDDHWENDPFLTSTPERSAKAAARAFENMRSQGVKPEQLPNEVTREEYAEYLRHAESRESERDGPQDAG